MARKISERMALISPKIGSIKICHICGTHEWTITHFGIRNLLPKTVELIAGPGCPVCIVPASEIDEAIQIAQKGVVVTCFGDVLRVPGSRMSLLDAKAEGADVRVVYSVADSIKMAANEKAKEFVFVAVGFETTSPSTAVEIMNRPPKNHSFIISHRLIPPAMKLLVELKELNLQGVIAPGHVSTIIGLEPFEIFVKEYNMPIVVAGFEPLDILYSVYMMMKQIEESEPRLENEYSRVVAWEGNVKAKKLLRKVFNKTAGNWRGLGMIPSSKLTLQKQFSGYDANLRYETRVEHGLDTPPGCKCPSVVVGRIKPIECSLFMKSCTPQKPVGACMVSSEGTCRIWARTISERK